ncbi:MAG: hypothetical protein H0U76_22760 [Ktedonobacteraceae bacterium]|nr:hypothetical protein [Ktedonobacteraceae bacterium]
MDIRQLLAGGGTLHIIAAVLILGRPLINYFGTEAIAKTQKDKPKSRLQRFFGWCARRHL